MTTALTARAAKDSAFAQKLDASVRRVIALKVTMGLASCG